MFTIALSLSMIPGLHAKPAGDYLKSSADSVEQPELRTRYSKTFQNANGTRTWSASAGSVHFQDGRGAWQEIDTAIKPLVGGPYAYGMTQNAYHSFFAPDASAATVVRVENGDRALAFGIKGAQRGPVDLCENSITYKNAIAGADLRFTTKSDEMSEEIILHQRPMNNVWEFELNMEGVRLQTGQEGTLDFVDVKTGERLWVMPKPFMFDATGTESAAVSKTLVQHWGKTYLVVKADPAWLNDPARRYPVTVDPTMSWTTSSADTYIRSGSPGTVSSNPGLIQVGLSSTTSVAIRRGLVAWDMSGAPTQSQVANAANSVRVKLYQASAGSQSATVTITLYPVTVDWFEANATWTLVAANVGGALASQSCKANGDYTWSWNGNTAGIPVANRGLLVRSSDEATSSSAKNFQDRDNYTPATGYLPRLEIDFTCGFRSANVSENVGTPSGTTAIASYTGWQNQGGLTYTGTADVRTTSASSGYPGASGSGNVYIADTSGKYFEIGGINSSGLQDMRLSFGMFKSTTASSGSDLAVEVSSDGTSYTALSVPALPTGSGTAIWYSQMASGTIPAASNLRIRFRQTAAACQYRIDDVKLTSSTASIMPMGSSTLCGSGSVVLKASGGSSWAWSPGTGLSSTTVQNPTASPSSTTAYTVTVTDAYGCTSQASQTVTVNAVPSAPTAGSDSPLCAGATLHLTATEVSGATYAWSGPNGFTSSDQNPTVPSATTAASGTYHVTATVNGCTSADSTTAVTVNPAPTASGISGATSVAIGQIGSVYSVTPPNGASTYAWSVPAGASFTGDGTTSITVNWGTASSGSVTVTETTAGGCVGSPVLFGVTVGPNSAPSAPAAKSMSTAKNTSSTIFKEKLLAGATDVDSGDVLSVSAAGPSSAQGGAVAVQTDDVKYTPPSNWSGLDSFTYSISDGNGGTAVGTVNVNVTDNTGVSPNIVSPPAYADGKFSVTFAGIPNAEYTVQYAEGAPAPPWTKLKNVTAGANGLFVVEDTASESPSRYYRTVYPSY